jgi:O-antigen/teichoic acid export membrane protein
VTQERNRRIVASAGFGVFQRVVQVACSLLLLPIVLRALGPARFGVWGAAASLAWLGGWVDIGMGSALVTLVARALARNEPSEARIHVTGALTIGSCLSGLLLGTAAIVWAFVPLRGNSAAYMIAFVGLALNIPLNSANNVWMALQKGYVAGFWELVQTLLTTVTLISATAFTVDVRVFVALVYAGFVASNFCSLIHLFALHPELRPRGRFESLSAMREVGTSGILYFTLAFTGGLSFMLDNVLALQLLGSEASAQMTIAMRICMTVVGLLVVLSQPLWPAFIDAVHTADRAWIRRSLVRSTALLVGATAAGGCVLILYGKPLLRLWLHTDLGIGEALLLAIVAWMLAQAAIRVSSLLLNGLSLIRFQIVVTTVATTIAFVMKFTLASRFGVSAILWGTSITLAFISFPASAWRIYRWADQAARQENIG